MQLWMEHIFIDAQSSSITRYEIFSTGPYHKPLQSVSIRMLNWLIRDWIWNSENLKWQWVDTDRTNENDLLRRIFILFSFFHASARSFIELSHLPILIRNADGWERRKKRLYIYSWEIRAYAHQVIVFVCTLRAEKEKKTKWSCFAPFRWMIPTDRPALQRIIRTHMPDSIRVCARLRVLFNASIPSIGPSISFTPCDSRPTGAQELRSNILLTSKLPTGHSSYVAPSSPHFFSLGATHILAYTIAQWKSAVCAVEVSLGI